MPRTPRAVAEWESKEADVIFAGTVERLDVTGWPLQPVPGKTVSTETKLMVTFSNVRLYRGAPRERFIVETGMGGGDCGYAFEEGEAYLVYAYGKQTGNGTISAVPGWRHDELNTGICTGTKPLKYSDADLRLLRKEPALPEDLLDLEASASQLDESVNRARICGKISLPTHAKPQQLLVRIWQVREEALSLLIRGDDTATQDDGSFCFEGA
jgi:hypothetical protein